MTITRIDSMSLAKLSAVIYGLGGLIMGLLTFLVSLFAGALAGQNGTFSVGLGGASIILFPLLYGFVGFVASWAGAGLYNFVAKRVGGVKIEVS